VTIRIFLLSLALAATAAHAQPDTRLEDPFLDNLVGSWDVTRRVRGTTVQNTLAAEWVLQHRFVQLHMKDASEPPKYEAIVLIGFDPATRQYVAHWTDTFGGGASALGRGKRVGNSVDFVFEYPDTPFHNTFSWNPDTRGWTMLLEAQAKDGKRAFFAEDTVRRK
jgi:hypothetical protein